MTFMTFRIDPIIFRDPTPAELEQILRPRSSPADAYSAIRMSMVGWSLDDRYEPARLENVLAEEDVESIHDALAERLTAATRRQGTIK